MNNEVKIEENMTEPKKKLRGNISITCRINPNTNKNYMPEYNPHSPKINNKEFRCNSQPKLFSLIDIKDQYHSKATSLPMQYDRKLYENINKIYPNNGNNINTVNNNDINEINNNIKKTIMKMKKDFGHEKILRKNKSQENINSKDYKDYRVQSALICRKEKSYLPICCKNLEIKGIQKVKRDKLMPVGYELYEKDLKVFNENYVHNNYITIKNQKNEDKQMLIRKLNKLKQNKSDIFFIKEKERQQNEEKKNGNEKIINDDGEKNYISLKDKLQKNQKINKYHDSDIFNLRLDKNIIEKSGERSYFKKIISDECKDNNKKTSYNVSNETLLGWRLRGYCLHYIIILHLNIIY